MGSTTGRQVMGGLMRVSVVATGIDATDVNTEIPVAAPLTERTFAASADRPWQKKHPQPQLAPAGRTGRPSSLCLKNLDVQRAAAEEQVEDIFADQPSAQDDDLPAPAYQPKVAAFEPRQEAIAGSGARGICGTPCPCTRYTITRSPGTSACSGAEICACGSSARRGGGTPTHSGPGR